VATIRGDALGAGLFTDALALVRSRHIVSDADLGPLLDAPPPDTRPDIVTQLRHMFDAGAWVLLESALADLPADLRWLFESGAVTLEQLRALHVALGVTSEADLVAEIRREAVRHVPGLGSEVEAAIAGALRGLRAPMARLPLGQAMTIADLFLSPLRAVPGIEWAEPVGSLRRGQDTVGDIEILAPAKDPTKAFNTLLEIPNITRCLHRGPRRLYLLTNRIQVGVRCPKPERAGAAFLHLTGSNAHFDGARSLAQATGWALEPEGLDRGNGQALLAESEEEIYAALELQWIPPEIRNGDDEIEAARNGALPVLVSRDAIRGDLHMHTDFSDGRDTVETMVHACLALEYEYMAITDHSPHSASSRNLSTDSVTRQAEEIARLRERFPEITILHGCEVDILLDGRLDFSDRVLERFDIVLASLHEQGGHAPAQLLRRYLAAMRHPLVTLITHPTNRLLPHRPGYDLDYDRLFATAVETSTAVEIDGAPSHLDLDGALARRAIAAGASVAIDSDCHRAEMLDRQMRLGVTTARRGWVEPRHVLNTRSIGDVRSFIAAKRAR
jgi:DNA polymerase (family 10)